MRMSSVLGDSPCLFKGGVDAVARSVARRAGLPQSPAGSTSEDLLVQPAHQALETLDLAGRQERALHEDRIGGPMIG